MTEHKRKLTLALIEEKIRHLPLLPSVVCDMMHLDQESPHFFEKAAQLSEIDPPLATRVLAIANSASAAPTNPIIKMHDALIRVGANKIQSLILALSVTKIFVPSKPEHKAIWQHSIETAVFSRFLASQLNQFTVDSEQAYTAGLLHDIGRFVLFEISARAIEVIDTRGWDSPIELPLVEERILGFTHANVGFIAAKKWQLPKELQNVIRDHHHYNIWQEKKSSEEFNQLLTVVQFADLLSVFVEKNIDWPKWTEKQLTEKITRYCHHPDWPQIDFPIEAICKALPKLTKEVHQDMLKLGIS